jgi:hypothetical protein
LQLAVHVVLFNWYYSRDTVPLDVVLFTRYCSPAAAAAGSLPRVVTMSDNIEVAVLCVRLEAIVKEAEDIEA